MTGVLPDDRSLASLGYRMPAEWEPHAATWVSWPHKEQSWPGKLDLILPVFARMVAEISHSEAVHVNVCDVQMAEQARSLIGQHNPSDTVTLHLCPTNDAWCRDHGAIIVVRDSETDQGLPRRVALDWKFNAWGGKYPPFDLDNRVPGYMAESLEIPARSQPYVLEGGAIDVNGEGLLLTSESCLLNPNRNPELDRSAIERMLCENLGVELVLWLGDGIEGDDTDGHVDDMTRFVGPRRILTAIETNPHDPNHVPLRENLERLESLNAEHALGLEIQTLPMPAPVIHESQRLPASYANFYIANTVVLVPTYATQAADAEALATLRECFPDRQVIGIDCTDMVWGLGAFHCLTQQIPR